MRRLKIVSDGTPQNTHVYVLEDGKEDVELADVQEVTWECRVGSGLAVATLKVADVETEVIGEEDEGLGVEGASEGFECGYEKCPGGHPTDAGVCKAMFTGEPDGGA